MKSTDYIESWKPRALETLILSRYVRHNLLALRQVVGQDLFLKLVDRFANLFIRFPAAADLKKMQFDLKLAMALERIRQAEQHGTAAELHRAEEEMRRISLRGRPSARSAEAQERICLTLRNRAAQVLSEIEKAGLWLQDVERQEGKNP